MKSLMILIAVLSVGCSVATAPVEATPDATCPEVQCGWEADGRCSTDAAFSSKSTREEINEGAGACWIYTASCVLAPESVGDECIPDKCRQNQFTTCEQVAE